MIRAPGRAALLLGWAAASAAPAAGQQGTLRDARIQIGIVGDTARVTARYRLAGTGDSLRLNAIRIAGQGTAFDGLAGNPRLRLDTLPGLFRLTAAGRSRGFTLVLQYRVAGDLARIPLFVPEAPTAPGESRLVILVDGLGPDRTARFPFPRFTRPGPGTWVATPAHLPAFVALVAPAGGVPVPAIAQWSALLLALGGTGVWLLAQLGARRRP